VRNGLTDVLAVSALVISSVNHKYWCISFQRMDILLRLIEDACADYAEARFHKREKTQIILRTGELQDIVHEIYSGVGIRVLYNGAWGFSSINSIDGLSLRKALETATKLAKATSQKKKEKVHLQDVSPVTGEFKADIKDPLPDHSLEEKVELCIETDNAVRSHEYIKSSYVHYGELLDSKWIVTSDGTIVHISDSKPHFQVGAVARNGSSAAYVDAVSNTGGWEIFKNRSPESMVQKATSTAQTLLRAHYPRQGKTTVILDPGLVGLLCHEAVGHTMEADFALSGAVAKDRIGEKVASECVTIMDSGKINTGGWVPVDDEGVESRDVILIKNGVLTDFLHDRETAYIMDAAPTGNARAWEYDYEPLIRMRTTYAKKGDWELEEIIEDTKKGYLMKGAGSGQADANAHFMFQVKEVCSIEDGEPGAALRDTIITGNAFDVLKSVDAVGNTVFFDMGFGVCEKSQPARVDGGGPYIRCEVQVGGR
jgi:TldD protein